MTEWLRWFALLSLGIYFLVDYLDGRRVNDEREELIKLKALELAHKASMAALTALAGVLFFFPWMNAQFVILAMIAAALYGEVLAKVYYRWRL